MFDNLKRIFGVTTPPLTERSTPKPPPRFARQSDLSQRLIVAAEADGDEWAPWRVDADGDQWLQRVSHAEPEHRMIHAFADDGLGDDDDDADHAVDWDAFNAAFDAKYTWHRRTELFPVGDDDDDDDYEADDDE